MAIVATTKIERFPIQEDPDSFLTDEKDENQMYSLEDVFKRYGESEKHGLMPPDLIIPSLIGHSEFLESIAKEHPDVLTESSQNGTTPRVIISERLAVVYRELRDIENYRDSVAFLDLQDPNNVEFLALASMFGISYIGPFDHGKILGWWLPFSLNSDSTIVSALQTKGRSAYEVPTSVVCQTQDFESFISWERYTNKQQEYIRAILGFTADGYSLGLRVHANTSVPHRKVLAQERIVQAIIPGNLDENTLHPSLEVVRRYQELTGLPWMGITSANSTTKGTIYTAHIAYEHLMKSQETKSSTPGVLLVADANHHGTEIKQAAIQAFRGYHECFPDPLELEEAIREEVDRRSQGMLLRNRNVSTTIFSLPDARNEDKYPPNTVIINRLGSFHLNEILKAFESRKLPVHLHADNIQQLQMSNY